MSVESGTPAEEATAICRNKDCRHILIKQFINYQWVIGNCPNPDCFYHTHPQEETEDNRPQPW